MIEYVEIRDKDSREIIGLIDSAKSVIWHSVYYGVGDFEIYAQATESHIALLQEGNYITRPNDIEVGIIEKIQTESSLSDGDMIIASGRFAKSILDRRHIYKLSGKTNTPTILSGNVEAAIRSLITNNAINCPFDVYRNIPFLELGALAGISKIIVDKNGNATQKQVSYDNLLNYSEEVLKEYELGSIIIIDDDSYKLQYKIYEGSDRSIDNTSGNDPVIFAREYDNLNDSKYSYDSTTKKNSALIGGAGEGLERFYSLIGESEIGINRRETWVDASSLNRKYKDDHDQEQEYTDAEYKAMLDAKGKQDLALQIEQQAYEATININGGQWKLNEDYFLGDIVTFQDNELGKYANVRISELTEVQDESGYTLTPAFEFELAEEEPSNFHVLTTENHITLLTENGRALLTEDSEDNVPSLSSELAVKISELPASEDLYDGCCVPVVTNGETKKFTFALLKQKFASIFLKKNEVADYIVEQGTSGNWNYRKWNSGIAECWGIDHNIIDFNKTISGVSGFVYAPYSITFPFQFTSITEFSGHLANLSGGFISSSSIPSSGQMSLYLIKIGGLQSVDTYLSFNVKGRWK